MLEEQPKKKTFINKLLMHSGEFEQVNTIKALLKYKNPPDRDTAKLCFELCCDDWLIDSIGVFIECKNYLVFPIDETLFYSACLYDEGYGLILLKQHDYDINVITMGFIQCCELGNPAMYELPVKIINTYPIELLHINYGFTYCCNNDNFVFAAYLIKQYPVIDQKRVAQGLMIACKANKFDLVSTVLDIYQTIDINCMIFILEYCCMHNCAHDVAKKIVSKHNVINSLMMRTAFMKCMSNYKFGIEMLILCNCNEIPKFADVFIRVCMFGSNDDLETCLKKFKSNAIDTQRGYDYCATKIWMNKMNMITDHYPGIISKKD
jgi:hypothetical protein